jgi:LAGLIDADG endonuclease
LCRLKIWLFTGKSFFFKDNPQETKRLVGSSRSSETKRQSFSIIKSICFSTKDPSSGGPNTLSKITKKNLNYYLAGLIEGDGTIIVPRDQRDKKGRKTYPSIQIIFGLMDLPLALIIQKTLGYGSIARKKGLGAYILTINSKEGCLKTIALVNGKFRTDKIKALGNLLE